MFLKAFRNFGAITSVDRSWYVMFWIRLAACGICGADFGLSYDCRWRMIFSAKMTKKNGIEISVQCYAIRSVYLSDLTIQLTAMPIVPLSPHGNENTILAKHLPLLFVAFEYLEGTRIQSSKSMEYG